jgi:hypothetical protein
MRIRTPVVLLLVAGAGYWIYKTHPTVSGFVDDLTSPLMSSKAAVKESEYKRIVAEAVPVPEGEEVPLAALKEGMKTAEVKELLGTPERVEWFREKGRERLRWTYVRARRVIVFEDGRVVSIAIR